MVSDLRADVHQGNLSHTSSLEGAVGGVSLSGSDGLYTRLGSCPCSVEMFPDLDARLPGEYYLYISNS